VAAVGLVGLLLPQAQHVAVEADRRVVVGRGHHETQFCHPRSLLRRPRGMARDDVVVPTQGAVRAGTTTVGAGLGRIGAALALASASCLRPAATYVHPRTANGVSGTRNGNEKTDLRSSLKSSVDAAPGVPLWPTPVR
jgi:hypothetical protein